MNMFLSRELFRKSFGILIVCVAGCAGLIFSASAHAASGIITITGQISSQTCTINGGTADSGNITLTQCANTGSVSTSLQADPAPVGTATANLVNSNGAAGASSVSTPVLYSVVYQ
jgi:type 1 fimbria pilin